MLGLFRTLASRRRPERPRRIRFAGDCEKREPQYLDISIVVKQHVSATDNFFFSDAKHPCWLARICDPAAYVCHRQLYCTRAWTVFVQPVCDWPVLEFDLSL